MTSVSTLGKALLFGNWWLVVHAAITLATGLLAGEVRN